MLGPLTLSALNKRRPSLRIFSLQLSLPQSSIHSEIVHVDLTVEERDGTLIYFFSLFFQARYESDSPSLKRNSFIFTSKLNTNYSIDNDSAR